MPSVVDLPHPVGPTIVTNSPFATDMLKSRSATVARPSGEMKRQETLRSSMAGCRVEFIAGLT
ncbi:hypothetical protein [Caballeronia grimmiae]|uniref:hypothetical protein n=1 Tax=Caballeronia grimmiae TaxID=1071679 RepID=UPI0038BDF3F6